MPNSRVLVSGASIAGPSVAYWLARYGFDVTVVERAAALREGGFAVDFRGKPHLAVLERMGILEEAKDQQTNMRGLTFVDAEGSTEFALPGWFLSGDLEIERGALSKIIYEKTQGEVEYLFGDSIAALTNGPDQVHVAFESGLTRVFDLVIGADGLHSNVRRLVFGHESQFLEFGGYYVAGGFDVPNTLGLDHITLDHGVPGRSMSLSSHHRPEAATPVFVWHSKEQIDYDRRDIKQLKRIVATEFAGLRWEVPRVLEAMNDAEWMYFDSISQVKMDTYSRGRAVLIGDAGYGATMGGLGTGLAVVSAYVLAGELARADGDHTLAFARYEEMIRDYAKGCQKLADGAGPFLAPRTRRGRWIRNASHRLLTRRPMAGWLQKMTVKAAAGIELEDYSGVLA
ncbi:FAD-dependent monooxygenase [Hoyosella altamirensis]|uniref:2-polyprenyl-6-methoxyphenol hydroxylase-like FAD-dependent oxidoreductase n=1 Tax=Hoyosella altamirensis TaxID=616997 RepID=A0A839RQM3_9ACTN|nr:FAD-dependent monooxygenase [Hoyosella altamirensis]MBB3038171.1 2-polyprenyl-6-methoxyphenol hydroxylase-like FAD-dependent oxidoreductase [Hoyosella altamirensis]